MKSPIIFIIIIGLAVFVLGAGTGAWYQSTLEPQKPQTKAIETAIKSLSSKLVSPLSAFGIIKEIGNNYIIITAKTKKEDLYIKTKKSVPVSLYKQENGSSVRQELSSQDLKIGDALSVGLKLLEDGSFEALSINISAK